MRNLAVHSGKLFIVWSLVMRSKVYSLWWVLDILA